MKLKTVFSFEGDMRSFKKDVNPVTRWEKLKEYAVKNNVPLPIERRAERKIIPGESATEHIEYYYNSKFFELETSIASYVDRRRMLLTAISTFILTTLLHWIIRIL